MTYPANWKKYIDSTKNKNESLSKSLCVFSARYRIAKSLKGVDLVNISKNTQNTYLAALRVQLAHNALESLATALEKKHYNLEVINPTLAKSFRGKTGATFLASFLDFVKPNLKTNILNWLNDDDNYDLNVIAAVTRHSFVHGHFTAYGSSIANSITAQKLIQSLADALLDACDFHFSEFLKNKKNML